MPLTWEEDKLGEYLIKVEDVNKEYKFEFEAKSTGQALPKGYFYIQCLDKQYREIKTEYVNVVPASPEITIMAMKKCRKILLTNNDPTPWVMVGNDKDFVAIYADGDTTKLPLFGAGTCLFANKTDGEIHLKEPLDPSVSIQFEVSKAKHQTKREDFVYVNPALNGAEIPEKVWTKYEGSV